MNKILIKKINDILLKEWDPIGIKDLLEANDEYRFYISEIYQVASDSDSYVPVFELLREIETDRMGLSANEVNTLRCAKLLFIEIKNNANL